MSAEPGVTLPRCCDTHGDWNELCQHLAAQFPAVSLEDIVGEVANARAAAVRFGIAVSELLFIVERIATNRLMLHDGQLVDRTHLDPQPHRARRSVGA